jgi:hypothetical protein
VNGPEWDDALLADLGRAYRNHLDVADLVAGVRRVLALCNTTAPRGLYPEDIRRALNHLEESP